MFCSKIQRLGPTKRKKLREKSKRSKIEEDHHGDPPTLGVNSKVGGGQGGSTHCCKNSEILLSNCLRYCLNFKSKARQEDQGVLKAKGKSNSKESWRPRRQRRRERKKEKKNCKKQRTSMHGSSKHCTANMGPPPLHV